MALGTLEIGLSDSEIQQVQSILGLFPHIEEVFLFGSRARGDYKRGSDIDLSIKGEELTREDLSQIWATFDASLLPYFVDIVSYSKLKNTALKEHIDRFGILVYRRDCDRT